MNVECQKLMYSWLAFFAGLCVSTAALGQSRSGHPMHGGRWSGFVQAELIDDDLGRELSGALVTTVSACVLYHAVGVAGELTQHVRGSDAGYPVLAGYLVADEHVGPLEFVEHAGLNYASHAHVLELRASFAAVWRRSVGPYGFLEIGYAPQHWQPGNHGQVFGEFRFGAVWNTTEQLRVVWYLGGLVEDLRYGHGTALGGLLAQYHF